jgi:hypothetical protein
MHIPRNVRAASALIADGLDDETDADLRDHVTNLIRSDPQVRRAIAVTVASELKTQARAAAAMAPRGGRRG